MTSTSLVAARLLFGGIQKGYAWTTRSVSPVRVRRTATRSVARGTGRILVRDAAVSAAWRVEGGAPPGSRGSPARQRLSPRRRPRRMPAGSWIRSGGGADDGSILGCSEESGPFHRVGEGCRSLVVLPHPA